MPITMATLMRMTQAQIELIMRSEEKELTLIDMAGKIVTIPQPVERVVSLSCLIPE